MGSCTSLYLQKVKGHISDGLGMLLGRWEVRVISLRDFESKKHRYSTNSYLEVLEDQIEKCWQPGLIFIQDNASIHTAKKVKE